MDRRPTPGAGTGARRPFAGSASSAHKILARPVFERIVAAYRLRSVGVTMSIRTVFASSILSAGISPDGSGRICRMKAGIGSVRTNS